MIEHMTRNELREEVYKLRDEARVAKKDAERERAARQRMEADYRNLLNLLGRGLELQNYDEDTLEATRFDVSVLVAKVALHKSRFPDQLYENISEQLARVLTKKLLERDGSEPVPVDRIVFPVHRPYVP